MRAAPAAAPMSSPVTAASAQRMAKPLALRMLSAPRTSTGPTERSSATLSSYGSGIL